MIFLFLFKETGWNKNQRCSVRKGVLRNFTKLTGKHLCQSLFLMKLQAFEAILLFSVDSLLKVTEIFK